MKATAAPEVFLTMAKSAERLRISKHMFRKLVAAGTVKPVRGTRMYLAADLDQLAAGQAEAPANE